MTAVYGTSAVKRLRSTKAEIAALESTITEVCEAEHPLSVRAVFYRVMSKGAVPKTEAAYRRVQNRVLLMRRAKSLPYGWITDGSRDRYRPRTFSSVDDALYNLSASYRRALWDEQGVHVEIWSEKDALTGVVYPVTSEWDVPLLVARGFSSDTFLWNTAQDIIADDKPAVIYQLGDHDPSGMGAWVDIQKKLTEFAPGVEFEFKRLAVTPEQIDLYQLPTRPTKQSDTRARKFVGESVEVDAIPSHILRDIVRDAIESWIDPEALRLTRLAESSEREGLRALAEVGVIDHLGGEIR